VNAARRDRQVDFGGWFAVRGSVDPVPRRSTGTIRG
jgi:hypothetical protein